jgi:large subunit ribosomal protein L35
VPLRRSRSTQRARCPQSRESESGVPKMKSHKGSQKRIGVTGSGKPIRVKSWRGHHLELKSSRRTRRYAGKALIGPEHADQVARLLPYLKKG